MVKDVGAEQHRARVDRRLRSFRVLSHDEDRLPHDGSLFLDAVRVREHNSRKPEQLVDVVQDLQV